MALTKPLTINERKYLKEYIEEGLTQTKGKNVITKDGKKLRKDTIYSLSVRANKTSQLHQVLDSVGLTEHHIAKKIKEKTDAKKTIFFSNRGIVTDVREVDDHHTQLKAIELAAELRGMKIDRRASLNLNMTAEDIRNLRNDELENLLKQCDEEIKRLSGNSV